MRTYLRNYLYNNFMEYVKLLIILAITIVVSILVINNTGNEYRGEIKTFVDSRIEQVKSGEKVDKISIFNNSIKDKLKEFIFVAFLASSIIGLPIAYFIIVKRIFSIGYTISAIFATQPTKTSIIFICNSLIFHNIIYLISLFIVLISGLNLIKTLLRREKINIKLEILRFMLFTAIGSLLILISATFEAFVTTSILNLLKKYL